MSVSSHYRPLVDFMIVGAQKCGTTALAQYLGQHPQIRMSSEKEPHLFDAPDYSPGWTPAQIDDRYRPFFALPDGASASPDGTSVLPEGAPASSDGTSAWPKGTHTLPAAPPAGTPARIRHRLPAVHANASSERGRAPSGPSDAPSSTPASSASPRDQAGRRLDALATQVGDGCGLAGKPSRSRGATSGAEVGPGGVPLVSGTEIRGEATPVYLFFPEIAPELKRYNPALKLIVLLRDPVERAISHYYMEKNRDCENLPLWLALCAEPGRLRRCADPRRPDSAWRQHSYRARGLYSRQLQNLYRYFDPAQVLLVCNTELAARHQDVLDRTFEFLGVPVVGAVQPHRVFEGERNGRPHRLVTWMLRLSFLFERRRLRRLFSSPRPVSPESGTG